MNPHEHLVH